MKTENQQFNELNEYNTEDSLARLSERQREKINELTLQRDRLRWAVAEALLSITFESNTAKILDAQKILREALQYCEYRGVK